MLTDDEVLRCFVVPSLSRSALRPRAVEGLGKVGREKGRDRGCECATHTHKERVEEERVKEGKRQRCDHATDELLLQSIHTAFGSLTLSLIHFSTPSTLTSSLTLVTSSLPSTRLRTFPFTTMSPSPGVFMASLSSPHFDSIHSRCVVLFLNIRV